METNPSAQVQTNPTAPDLTNVDSIQQWIVLGLVRHLVTLAAGWLITHGVFANSDADMLIGALVALAMFGWSALEKLLKAQAHDLALRVARDKAAREAMDTIAESVSVPASQPSSAPPGSGAGVGPKLAIAAICTAALFLTGCANNPYYLSGVTAGMDTSKDGARISGGQLGVQFSPNPYYPLPKAKGLSK